MSKSVATIDNLLFFKSNRTLESIGRVFFFFQQFLVHNLKILTKYLF